MDFLEIRLLIEEIRNVIWQMKEKKESAQGCI